MSGAEAVDSLGKSVDVLIDKKLNELTLGFNKVNYIATDRSGNVVTKSRTVTLNNKCLDDNDCYEVIKKPANLIYNTGDTNYGNLDLEVKMNLAIAVPNITANSFTLTPLADLTKTPGVKTVTATYLYRANTVLQTVTVTFDITVIDEENPELTVNPATVEMTYGDDLNVLEGVTALDDADGDITNNITADKTDTKTFALGNNTVTYTVADSSGNSVTETRTYYVKRNTQQVNSLTSTIIYMPHVEGQYVNRNVNAEVRFYETVTIINNPSAIYTFTDNGTFTLRFKDKDGVEGSVDLAVSWIDKKAPVLSIEPDTVTVEKGSSFDLLSGVTATDDLSGVKSITASKKIEDFVLGNNIVTYTATDKAGNTTKGTRMYILTITPEELETYATITYSSTSLTKDSVTATISFSENDITVTNNGGSNSYVFTENGTFTFEFTDKYGVVATKTAEVTWIDDVLPDATFTYSPTGWSNNSIEVTLNATEVITTPIGWTKINDTTYTKVFTDYQSSVSVLLTDAVGNENTVATGEIKVDKVAPSIVINNANINANNQASVDVNVSITDDLSGVKLSYYIPAGNNLGFDTSTKAKALAFINDQANNAILPGLVITGGKFTVIANGEYWIYSIDNAGNEIISDTKIKVTNLYEPDPTETDNEEGFVDPVTGLRVTVSKQAHDYRGLFLRLDANRTVSISNNNGFEVAEVRLAQGIKTLADFQNDLTLGTKIEITNGVALNKVQSTFTNMYTIYFKNTEGDEQVHVFYNSSYIGVGIPATDLFWKWGRI